ncbi:hypothetical protein VTO58DRAFT_105467 [Aureobasidium pullulans]
MNSTVFSNVYQSGTPASLAPGNSSCPTCPSRVLTVTSSGTVTTVFASAASCTAAANASTITLSQSFVSTIFTRDPACRFINSSSAMGMNTIISATRFTTVYGPDVTVTMPGSSATTLSSDPYCDTCPDECYMDFDDDGVPDAQTQAPTNSTSLVSRASSSTSAIAVNSTAPVPPPVVIADNSFENGTGNPLNSSASSPAVIAEIAQSNDSSPLTAQSGDSYLFLTFNDGSAAKLFRRQSAAQPLVYNATQYFATIAGDTYNLSAYAQQAQNGPNPPDCSIRLCVYDSCSSPAPLRTRVYQQYYYLFSATSDDDSALATFSITCVGNAYVALDSIAIVDIPPPSDGSAPPSDDSVPPSSGASATAAASDGGSVSLSTLSDGSVRTVTRTIVRTRTTSAIVSTAIYYTTTQYITSTYRSDNTYTTDRPTIVVSTAFATATSVQNLTVSAIVTSTSKLETPAPASSHFPLPEILFFAKTLN